MTTDRYTRLVTYLQARESTEISWSDASVTREMPDGIEVFSGWVDVRVPDVQENCGFNWVWTVEDLEDREEGWETTPYHINLPYNVRIYMIWDSEAVRHENDEGKVWFEGAEVATIIVPIDTEPSQEEKEMLHRVFSEKEGRKLQYLGGWTAPVVSEAIANWCSAESGRVYTAAYDADQAPSGEWAKLEETIHRIETGEEETYLVGVTDNGMEIVVSDEAFDALSKLDPEEAAVAMEIFQKLGKGFPEAK